MSENTELETDSSMVLLDTHNSMAGGKQHVYVESENDEESAEGVMMSRVCGTSDTAGKTTEKSMLKEADKKKYALSDTACLNCLNSIGMRSFREENAGSGGSTAEEVSYDPFGVEDESQADYDPVIDVVDRSGERVSHNER